MEDEQQVQYTYAKPNSQGVSEELIKVLFNMDKLLKDLERTFSGQRYDPHLKQYIQEREPMMNKKGINRMTSYMRGLINANIKGSDFDKETISTMAHIVWNTITYMIGENMTEWDVRYGDEDIVHSIAYINALAILNSAKDFASVEATSGSTQRRENVIKHMIPKDYQARELF